MRKPPSCRKAALAGWVFRGAKLGTKLSKQGSKPRRTLASSRNLLFVPNTSVKWMKRSLHPIRITRGCILRAIQVTSSAHTLPDCAALWDKARTAMSETDTDERSEVPDAYGCSTESRSAAGDALEVSEAVSVLSPYRYKNNRGTVPLFPALAKLIHHVIRDSPLH
eukprot:3456160-Rhodomonas_salina.1